LIQREVAVERQEGVAAACARPAGAVGLPVGVGVASVQLEEVVELPAEAEVAFEVQGVVLLLVAPGVVFGILPIWAAVGVAWLGLVVVA